VERLAILHVATTLLLSKAVAMGFTDDRLWEWRARQCIGDLNELK